MFLEDLEGPQLDIIVLHQGVHPDKFFGSVVEFPLIFDRRFAYLTAHPIPGLKSPAPGLYAVNDGYCFLFNSFGKQLHIV